MVPPGPAVLPFVNWLFTEEVFPGLVTVTLFPPGVEIFAFPADIPLFPACIPVFPGAVFQEEAFPGAAAVWPVEELPGAIPIFTLVWFPMVSVGVEYTLPAEPPSMADASLRHAPDLSKV